jgi:hypothetical protein
MLMKGRALECGPLTLRTCQYGRTEARLKALKSQRFRVIVVYGAFSMDQDINPDEIIIAFN